MGQVFHSFTLLEGHVGLSGIVSIYHCRIPEPANPMLKITKIAFI